MHRDLLASRQESNDMRVLNQFSYVALVQRVISLTLRVCNGGPMTAI